ncbi:MAG TPA: RHS repeat-associated core domain-containing protein [Caulobacteraceae bacterium]|nr:RHS repeat-associated core domain-containing protein [Caulobacteraceae bacterium]
MTTTNTLSQYTWDNANHLLCAAVRMNSAVFSSPPSSACALGTTGSAGPDRVTLYSYDAADELTQVTSGYLTGSQVNYETLTYTGDGLVASAADANGNTTTNQYDGFNRVCAIEFPGTTQVACPPTSGTWEGPSLSSGYGYDANGNVLNYTLRSGGVVTMTYDALNRMTAKSFSDSSQNLSFGWDLLNRPTSVAYTKTGGLSTTYTWDAFSRLTAETTGGQTMSYGYDGAGDRTGITWPDTGANALAASYSFDYLGRVTQISANGSSLASYAHDDLGHRTSIAPTNSTSTAYSWDGADRLSNLCLTFAKANPPLSCSSYLGGSPNVEFTLAYDPANAILTRAVDNDSYTATPSAGTNTYTPDTFNQYAQINSNSSTYDGRGNNTYDALTTHSFTYDLQNRLLSGSAPTAVTLTYDPVDRLNTSTAGSATTTFLFAGSMLVGEYNGSTILNRYIPGPGADEALLWYSGAGTSSASWLEADNLGSTVAWSNSSGANQKICAYEEFGSPGACGWGAGPRYRFTGQLEIPEGHVYDFKARAYQDKLGRFLQVDPMGLAAGLNLYAYAGNDPINQSDPSGMYDYENESPVVCWDQCGNNTGANVPGAVIECYACASNYAPSPTQFPDLVATAASNNNNFGFGGVGFGGGAAGGPSSEPGGAPNGRGGKGGRQSSQNRQRCQNAVQAAKVLNGVSRWSGTAAAGLGVTGLAVEGSTLGAGTPLAGAIEMGAGGLEAVSALTGSLSVVFSTAGTGNFTSAAVWGGTQALTNASGLSSIPGAGQVAHDVASAIIDQTIGRVAPDSACR